MPITPGRDLGVGLTKDWNVWTDIRFLSTSDGRYGLDILGSARTATVGLDRKVGDSVVAGFSASLEDSKTTGYNGFYQTSSRGVTVGPYVAFLMSPNWAIDASVSYSRLSNTLGLVVLDGSYLSQRLSGSVNLHAQYDFELVNIRPKLSVAYMRTFSDSYSLQGTVFGRSINVDFPSIYTDYGVVSFANEFNRVFTSPGGTIFMPYIEVGTQYEFQRPNDGQMLTADLLLATPSPWSFTVRSGVRMLLAESVLLEANVGYLSFGQAGLNLVEGRLHLSFSF